MPEIRGIINRSTGYLEELPLEDDKKSTETPTNSNKSWINNSVFHVDLSKEMRRFCQNKKHVF